VRLTGGRVTRTNEHGQPVGEPVTGWVPPPAPGPVELTGRWVRLEPLTEAHADDLYDAACGPGREPAWTYLAEEMPSSRAACRDLVVRRAARPDQVTLAVVPTGGGAQGIAAYLRVDPPNGSVEVGGILLAPVVQRTTAATEAMHLMAAHVFALGYRRYEWKCDALNAPSRAAARRLGFTYEGRFRQAVVTKGRSRDTDWFSITDREWRRLAPVLERWLSPDNFDDPVTGAGQRSSLSGLTSGVPAG
jgi:RimJ/RimL family protein N-acetyltransferase